MGLSALVSLASSVHVAGCVMKLALWVPFSELDMRLDGIALDVEVADVLQFVYSISIF